MMNPKIAGCALVISSLMGAGPAVAQPGIRLPAQSQPVNTTRGQAMPEVTSAQDQRIRALEQQNAQLLGRIALLEAAMTATQNNLTAMRTRFDGHRHQYRTMQYDWEAVPVVVTSGVTGDTRRNVGSVIRSTIQRPATEPPAPQ